MAFLSIYTMEGDDGGLRVQAEREVAEGCDRAHGGLGGGVVGGQQRISHGWERWHVPVGHVGFCG
jgi:hypothetical protein